LLTYPLSVDQFEEHESPDFMMRWPSGETTGLEVTRATEEGLQKNKSAAHKEYRQRKVDAERSETEPEPVSIPLPTAGWTDGERERGWSLMFRNAVEKKLVKLRGEPPEFRSKFKPAARHDLLVYDDTPFIGVDRTRVIATMQNCIRDLSGQQRAFGKISFISSLDLIFDLGGECRMLPYVEWTKVVPEDRDSLMTLAHRVEEAAQIAVKKAIRSHADAGRAIHYTDSRGRIIKETPDGRRFELQLLENGEEVIVKEL
jgi:hypothetical protein